MAQVADGLLWITGFCTLSRAHQTLVFVKKTFNLGIY